MIEPYRECGYRKVGGLYLVGMALGAPCDRLPIELKPCECCGYQPNVRRNFSYLAKQYFGKHEDCKCRPDCELCNPELMEQDECVLMRVSSRYYTPESFTEEALEQGISLRVSRVPREYEPGETWILLFHKDAIKELKNTVNEEGEKEEEIETYPGIFYAFKPTTIEQLIWESEATEEKLEDMKENGITPVIVPDGDPDHDPSRSTKDDVRLHKKKIKKAKEAEKEETKEKSETVKLEVTKKPFVEIPEGHQPGDIVDPRE